MGLRKQLEEALRKIEELEKQIEILKQDNVDLKDSIAKLNFTKEIPSFVKLNRKKRQKKPGQKEGHKGITRPIPNHVDEEVTLKFDRCPDCNTKLSRKPTEIKERYVEDIRPRRNYHVKKYKIHRSWCPKCKAIKSPKPIDVMPKCRFGLYFLLFVCFQKYGLSLTLNKIQKELWIYFGLKVSEGEISQTLTRAGRLFGHKFEELKERIKQSKYHCEDETGWRINGINYQLWAFIQEEIALFKIDKSRSHKVPKKIIGKDYCGTIGSDRFSAYNTLEEKTNCTFQKCWVHILRNTKKLASFYDKEGKYLHRRLKQIYKEAKEAEKKNDYEKVPLFIQKIEKLLKRKYEHQECKVFVRSIAVRHKYNLFRFVGNPEIKDNNNDVERALRHPVVMRKISGGNRSSNGARATEVMLSVIKTYQLQNKDFFKEGTNFLQNQFL
ncbi:MAG: IS66 family transposase [Nanoarchaeota archaeon]|nr:IS66 family transposase [Patescibacteria group bacterium]MBU1604763.1 IS66 family transposase [Nanoarchaeota archaeon]MBU2443243.1 IS66 family transposase [Nanoarchaeota archaeon]MBU2639161.1 IS66 family transposase [Nanoarchaeota archaeon]